MEEKMKRLLFAAICICSLVSPVLAQVSIGFSVSTLFAGVYGESLGENIDGIPVDVTTGYGLEDINTIRYTASIDLTYLWLETGISTDGPFMGGDIYGGDDANIDEYSLLISGNILLPFYRGNFSFFPTVGVEFAKVFSLKIDGYDALEAIDEMISIYNSRLTLKVGVGFDWKIGERLKIRTVGYIGKMNVNPNGYLDGFIPLFYGPGFSNFYVRDTTTTYIVSSSIMYILGK
jgi:hypothetical protein